MRFRKINAVMGLLTTALVLYHAGIYSFWMLSRCAFEITFAFPALLLALTTVLHAVFSILLLFLQRRGAEKAPCRSYVKLNRSVWIQRISGLLLLLLLGLHLTGAKNYYSPRILHAVLHPVFFAAALSHTAVSASKALISLGVGSAKSIRVVDIGMRFLCGALFAACSVGFYLCLFLGVAK